MSRIKARRRANGIVVVVGERHRFAILTLLAASAGCPGERGDFDPCNGDDDCGRHEVCMDGLCRAPPDAGLIVDGGILVDAGVMLDGGDVEGESGALLDGGAALDAGGSPDGGHEEDGGGGDGGALVDGGARDDGGGAPLDGGEFVDGGGSTSDSGIAVPVVVDTFSRSVSPGWGTPDVGDPWGIYNPQSATLTVNGTYGIAVAGDMPSYVDMTSGPAARDVAASTEFVVSATSGTHWVGVFTRAVAAGVHYGAEVGATGGGDVLLYVYRSEPTGYVFFGAPILIGATTAEPIHLELEVTGATPTTVCARAWIGAAARPASCLHSGADAEPALQAAGVAGLIADVPGNGAVSFDAFSVTRVGVQ